MIVIFPSSHKDYDSTVRLLEWCRELGNYQRHLALIVGAKTLDNSQVSKLDLLAKDCAFGKVVSIRSQQEDNRGWPYAPNQMFQLAVNWIEAVGRSAFLWVESDAVPLKPGWLDSIEAEYLRQGRPFMGTVYEWVSAERYLLHLNGNAVYPQNLRQLNPFVMAANSVPWDCTRPDITLPRTFRSPLFQHVWGDRRTNAAPTFRDAQSLELIRSDAVLFHRCKDGSLIDRLREEYKLVKATENEEEEEEPYPDIPLSGRIAGFLMWPFGPRPTKKKKGAPKELLIVRRTGAFGDAIAATAVSRKLIDMGYNVTFQCHPYLHPVMRLDPSLLGIEPTTARACDVDLNNAYEPHPKRAMLTFAEIYVETANKSLAQKGIVIESSVQCTPHFSMPDNHKEQALKLFSKFPKPWIVLCPRSASHNHRTVHDAVWQEAARHIDGSCFWSGNHGPAPAGIHNLNCESMLQVGAFESIADLVVSVDTGPLHLAAALGTQIVALLQSSSPELHLTDQVDFEMLAPEGLSCLNCQQSPCPLNEHYPPCQHFRPEAIAMMTNKKLRRFRYEEVSAVVTIYKPPSDRLNRCLNALLPQVSEIIVTRNADGIIPPGAMQHPKIRYVATRLPNIGYGRNANYGARHTSSDYILFLNDDVYLNPDTVGHLTSVIKGDPKIGMVGHLLRYPDGTIQHGGTSRSRGDFGWGHISHRRATPEIQNVIECENVTHASVLMRRRAFYEAGAYDERYFMYYEDNALNLQMRHAGWKIFYTPHTCATHDEHQTLKVYAQAHMIDNMRRARAVFDKSWGEYFRWNRNRALGDFGYLNK